MSEKAYRELMLNGRVTKQLNTDIVGFRRDEAGSALNSMQKRAAQTTQAILTSLAV
jgi:hypothetical protein